MASGSCVVSWTAAANCVQVVRLCFKLAVAVTSGLGLTGLNKGRVPDCTGHMQTACAVGWVAGWGDTAMAPLSSCIRSVDSLTWAGKMMKAGVQSLLLRTGTSDGAVCVPGIW